VVVVLWWLAGDERMSSVVTSEMVAKGGCWCGGPL